jgi:uncharacterized OB-fold protein
MTRILPAIDDGNRPFWDGCREGVLRLQRCECGHLRYPVAPLCPRCLSTSATWEEVSGHGEIYSFAVFRHSYNEAWRDRIPYAVALVRLDEGPIVISDVAVDDPAAVHVGMPVEVVFEQVDDEVAVPAFAPRKVS